VFTEVDRSLWSDVVAELRERYAAAGLRRAAGKIGESSNSEGERSNSEGERGKSSRSVARWAASRAKS
jgi:hypothetical protein